MRCPGGHPGYDRVVVGVVRSVHAQGTVARCRGAVAHHAQGRLLGLANDVGLLSEEYDPDATRLVGNFPQAYSHVALTNTAYNLSRKPGPADIRPNA